MAGEIENLEGHANAIFLGDRQTMAEVVRLAARQVKADFGDESPGRS